MGEEKTVILATWVKETDRGVHKARIDDIPKNGMGIKGLRKKRYVYVTNTTGGYRSGLGQSTAFQGSFFPRLKDLKSAGDEEGVFHALVVSPFETDTLTITVTKR